MFFIQEKKTYFAKSYNWDCLCPLFWKILLVVLQDADDHLIWRFIVWFIVTKGDWRKRKKRNRSLSKKRNLCHLKTTHLDDWDHLRYSGGETHTHKHSLIWLLENWYAIRLLEKSLAIVANIEITVYLAESSEQGNGRWWNQ